MTRSLPEPGTQRWQPLRAGLVDLFYYDAEEFWFRDGRLLLRGNNGTGKSKVLALTLPFLLDGELAAHRVEPDADPKKKMEWNLLLGGAHPYPERLGYTWLELGRIDEDGTTEFRTLGCGLKAVSGKGIARHWFFLTPQRVGVDLNLVDATGTALTRDRLTEALGEHGTIFDRARDYRRAVDEAFFGLGEQRYGALVDLLVQLRQPQLSKRPSENALSNALTEALPPLDQAVVADVADAFRSLEEDRDALAAMSEAHTAAESFLGHYRRYGKIAARRRAAQPRLAQSAYERVNRELTEADEAYTAATGALAAAQEMLAELERAGQRLQARDEALRASPEMRSARELERAAEDARRLAGELERAGVECEDATRQLARRQRRDAAAADRVATAQNALDRVRHACAEAAEQARIANQHAERVDAVLDAEPETEPRAQATAIAERQARAIVHVERLIRAVEQAKQALAGARHRVDELAGEAGELAERRQAAADLVSRRGAELVSAVRNHISDTTELRVADPAAVLAALELWVETLDGANPARTAAGAAAHEAAADHARLGAELDHRHGEAHQREAELTEEIARLEAGEDTAPPVPHTRDATSRSARAGAPLWQVIDFVDDVGPAERAGLEAALEAAGVLDAWLTPAGELLSPDTDDVLLRPSIETPKPVRTLAGALRPAVDRGNPSAAALTDTAVVEVLEAIGLGEGGETWVSPDGRFRLGVLDGAWHKPEAVYIGRGAREAARRARLAELRTMLSTVESELRAIAAARETLAERRRTLAAEQAAVPDDTELRNAHATVAGVAREYDRLTARQADAAEKLAQATTAAEHSAAALADGAAELGLPAEPDAVEQVREALARYQVTLAELWPTQRSLADARQAARDAAEELALAEEELVTHRERLAEVEQSSAAADERHQTLRGTVGAAVAELERQLAAVATERRHVEERRRTADANRSEAIGAQGKAEGQRERLAVELERAKEDRAAAAESMRRFVATGLLAVALPGLDTPDPGEPWAPDPTVRLARAVDRELSETTDDDTAWDRAQRRVTDELKILTDTLGRQGNSASARLLEDGIVVDVVFRGRPGTVPELAEALAEEIGERTRLLDEREREILENHLVNEVASTLQELISAAERQVALMNAELAARPTSTGMRLRLLWRAREDGPPGLAAARERLLRQTADAWSEEDRAAVGGFLQARIAEVRARDAAGTWLDHLTEALDYRTWNRFVIQRHAGGAWRSATGPASGGERVLAASVPLFAAASAHYASAGNPHAPRLVTLDEAFAGVDDNARAKYLGLLAAFDLDVVMTSEREWGCYPEVPGLAISQLSRTDDVAAVLVSSWEWDGQRRTRVDRPTPHIATAPVASTSDSDDQAALWS